MKKYNKFDKHYGRVDNPYYRLDTDLEDDYSEESDADSVVNDFINNLPKGIILNRKDLTNR